MLFPSASPREKMCLMVITYRHIFDCIAPRRDVVMGWMSSVRSVRRSTGLCSVITSVQSSKGGISTETTANWGFGLVLDVAWKKVMTSPYSTSIRSDAVHSICFGVLTLQFMD